MVTIENKEPPFWQGGKLDWLARCSGGHGKGLTQASVGEVRLARFDCPQGNVIVAPGASGQSGGEASPIVSLLTAHTGRRTSRPIPAPPLARGMSDHGVRSLI